MSGIAKTWRVSKVEVRPHLGGMLVGCFHKLVLLNDLFKKCNV